MKKLLLILLIFAFYPCISTGNSIEPRFGLYLVKENDVDINNAKLENTPLLTEKDILEYEWKTHSLILTENGLKKLPRVTDVSKGIPFIVVVNGERCYLGAFWTSISSFSYSNPVIVETFEKTRVVQIERAYPSEKEGVGTDPRLDIRIYNVFKEIKKLKTSEQGVSH